MSRSLKTLGLTVLITACLLFPACTQDKGKQVVVYTSVDDIFARPVAQEFEKTTGISVKLVTDTEETKSTGLLNRLIAEKNRPVADVFWSGDPARAALLKKKGVSAPYISPAAQGLPVEFSDPEGYWISFSTRARMIIYNSEHVAEGKKPTSIYDLVNERFKGKACIANPLFGTTSMHAAALFQVLGDEKAKQFFEDFATNGGQILGSNGDVKNKVASGQCLLGLTDSDDVSVAVMEGKPVGYVFPDQDAFGTLLIPNCAVLIKGAPHLAEAQKFMDFLLGPETERMLAQSRAAQIPLRPGVKGPDIFPSIKKIKAMNVKYPELAVTLEKIMQGFLKEWTDRNS
ncbi:MAG: iron ABC transporter substrate-binding protein [Thermodesulfatator sp.]|nr:MAG: iron ABC transporter substrate-binding protein [Thermodesulfatator sp.]